MPSAAAWRKDRWNSLQSAADLGDEGCPSSRPGRYSSSMMIPRRRCALIDGAVSDWEISEAGNPHDKKLVDAIETLKWIVEHEWSSWFDRKIWFSFQDMLLVQTAPGEECRESRSMNVWERRTNLARIHGENDDIWNNIYQECSDNPSASLFEAAVRRLSRWLDLLADLRADSWLKKPKKPNEEARAALKTNGIKELWVQLSACVPKAKLTIARQ